MRVLALADERPHASVAELVAAHEPACILLLGDLEPAWLDGIEEAGVRALGVRGNHDARVRGEDIDGRRVDIGGLTLAGFGGSPAYHGAGYGWTEEEAEARLAALPAADVLVTHAPPLGVNDEPDDPVHRGSPALLAWVQRHRPAWLLHGHTQPHPAQRVRRVGDTRVAYVRGAAALDLSAR